MDNKYINAYVDIAVGTIHEYLATNIQLKAQNKLANDLVLEKDKIIASLQADIESINKNNLEMQVLQSSAKTWEDSYNAMKNKVAHMETLTRQLIDMKKEIVDRDDKIKKLEDDLVKLNKKSRKKLQEKSEDIVVAPTPIIEKVTEQLLTDDF
jgi:hypothetical protein